MKKTLLALALTAMSLGVAHAEDTLAKIKASGSISLGVRDSSALSYTVGNDK